MIRSVMLVAALLSLAPLAAAQSPSAATPATPPAGSARAPRPPQALSWLAAGPMLASGHIEYASTVGGAVRLRGSGVAFTLDWATAWNADPMVDLFRPGLAWFGSEVPLAPFAGAHYALFWVQPDVGSDVWNSGVGGSLGFFPWRQQKDEGHRFGLSIFVTYDHAFSCSRACDVWLPQAALTWEPFL